VNPNSNQNRVPQGTELASLRATASHLQSVIDHNTQAAKVALERYQEIKLRYDAQALILEEIGSELHAAKLSADVLEEHASLLEPKLQELRGVLNPIRRYSDDILRLIFEEYVAHQIYYGEEGFATATLLSHVCQRWKGIALSTPSIWTDVHFKPQHSTRGSVSKASAFFDRVKALPTTIHLDIGSSLGYAASMPLSTIYRVPVISSLVLSIFGDAATAAIDAVRLFPNRHIDRLELVIQSPDPVHFGPFLSKFRSFRKFETAYVKFGSFTSPNLLDSLSKLEEIDFICVGEVPIVDLLAVAPQLKIMKLEQCDARRDSEGGIDECTSLNLWYFRADCEGVPWSKIRLPSLVEFKVDLLQDITDPDGFWDFLSQCHTITTMEFFDPNPEQFTLLASSVPKLRSLTLVVNQASYLASVLLGLMGFQLSSPLLPSLECFKLTCDGQYLEAATLEDLIRSRCLCRGHSDSTMNGGIPQALRLFEVKLRCRRVKWSHSPFLEKYLVEADSRIVVYRVVGQD
jgi:hypothetical protein